jgi:thioredoxin-like negative regulator of GroEL
VSESTPAAPEPAQSAGYRPLLLALAAVVVVLGVARTSDPGPFSALLALAVLVGVPVVAMGLAGEAGVLFALAAALGGWLAFQPTYEGGALAVPGLALHRLAYFAVPPLVLALALAERDRTRLNLGPVHLFAPALVMAAGSLVHLFLRWNAAGAESEIRRAAAVYAGIYGVLILVALFLRTRTETRAPAGAAAAPANRALELEEAGRFAMAAQLYERQGEPEKAAQAAERAGDWVRAARLYKRTGEEFNAAEMYYRARMFPEALECYENARAFPAAVRVCLQLGDRARAESLLEQSSYAAAVVKALEEGGHKLTAEQFRRANLPQRAAQAFEEAGEFGRAAEIWEHELLDGSRAAPLYLKAGEFLAGARLLESMGRRQEALEAYAATPAGAIHAARLYAASGRSREAADLLAKLPPAQLESLDDEATASTVARVMLDTGRIDEAGRIAQGLKRRGVAGGVVHLLLGRVFLAKGLDDLAEEELQFATSLPLEPADEIQASYLLGCVLEKSGKTEAALQIFQGILQKDLGYRDVQERYRKLKAAATA